jgi:hypothetical protein
MTKYPVYFEVTYYEKDIGAIQEGGFIYADDYKDAAETVEGFYGNNIENMSLVMLDECALILPIQEARKIKGEIEAL